MPPLLNWVTQLGDGMILGLFIIGGLWFRFVSRNALWEERSWFISQCIILSGFICLVLKILLGRARPKLWFNTHEYGFYWLKMKGAYWSFPSGHATTILSVAFGLSILFPRYRPLFILSGFFIASSRVLLGYHYLSDVLSASYLTLLEVITLVYFLRKQNRLSTLW